MLFMACVMSHMRHQSRTMYISHELCTLVTNYVHQRMYVINGDERIVEAQVRMNAYIYMFGYECTYTYVYELCT